MMTDPIADMLARIRNGALARHERVELGHSKLKERVAHVLKEEGFLDDVRVTDGVTNQRVLTLVLRYTGERTSAIDGLRRISKPGRRVYLAHDRIPRVRSGLGVCILSTSHGVLTDREARRQKVGGELLCEVW
jgi:small subunit ribosomal protein S8